MTLVLVAVLATLMLPEEILALPLSLILSDLPVLHFNLIGTLAGMIVPLGAWGFSILVMTEFMKDVPRELEEAARIDGAGDLRIFAQIILPMCKPALGVIGVFGFTMIWDQYLLPLLVSTDSSSLHAPAGAADPADRPRGHPRSGDGRLAAGPAALRDRLPVLPALLRQRSVLRRAEGLTPRPAPRPRTTPPDVPARRPPSPYDRPRRAPRTHRTPMRRSDSP
ncbi:carbohydrate ABC transporter permease [Streptomyces sp. NPDC091387]|uniref:carbohydrate ABC transporter permease n=1 Tax=Streptomyces sp. NPDC091387 TaxID=3365998 RepID=UPI003807D63C